MEGPPNKCEKWFLVVVFLLRGLGLGCEGCLEKEKEALLQLKPFFYLHHGPITMLGIPVKRYALYNWERVEELEGEENFDCCKWENVECDATTGRVTALSLTDRSLIDNVGLYQIGKQYGNLGWWTMLFNWEPWYLNASLFLPFEDLKTLSLSGNRIAGCLHNHGFEKLARNLKKLEVLDLSFNHFDVSNVLTSILEFSSLKSLNLSYNNLTAPAHTNGFGRVLTKSSNIEILDLNSNGQLNDSILVALNELPSLKYLDLSNNQISGSTHINGLKGLSRLSNLETLYLSENQLEINILPHLGDLSSLKTLDLEDCGLEGTIQIQEIFSNLINLKELYLSGNEIESFGSSLDDERQSGLIGLEVLSLTLKTLNNSILSGLGPFSKSLTRLHVQYSQSQGSISIDGIKEKIWGNLVGLEMGYNTWRSGRGFPCLVSCASYIKNARERGTKNLKGVDLMGVQAANNRVLPESLGLFSSLKTVHFKSYIDDFQVEPIQDWRYLSRLEELIVESYPIPTNFFEYIGNLTSLRALSFFGGAEGNLSFKGPFHLKNLESLKIINEDSSRYSLENNFLEGMTSLKNLSLTYCEIDGTISALGICELTSLEELCLSQNSLTGTLPDCFSNLKFLTHLDLSSNHFSGNISSLMSLTSMEFIDLSNNQFQIPSSLKPFFNHSKLKHFNGDNNHIFAETELHSLAPRFQLNFLSLSCCGNGGTLPKFLDHQHELQYVDLSNINLTGEFPSWLLENNTQLEKLFLYNNSLSGHLKFPFHSSRKLYALDISKNFLNGHIPMEFGKYLPGLTLVNISRNSLDGGIPSSIGDMRILNVLDLSNNNLSGTVPESLAMSCSSLLALILSNNHLQGQMFSSNFNLINLRILGLRGNNFTGEIPISLANSTSLSIIDVSHNHISGTIPRRLGNLSSLGAIIMSNNHIEGPIPTEFCKLNVQILDLSMNNISGTLPSCFGSLVYLTDVHLSKNRLSGPIPHSLCNSSSMVALDLSHNQLSGNIPNCLGNLSMLSYLLLKSNNLEGEIPNQLCQLENLGLIDLSQNNLSGGIPHCLNITASKGDNNEVVTLSMTWDAPNPRPFTMDYGSIELTTKSISYTYKRRNLRFLSGIDLSCNNLTGEIPHEMGNFRVLNLSHNSLRGQIPASLSNLTQIESLDLSYNNLSGGIPPQFVQLHFLADFNVSYNNLSGKPPPRTGQFASDIDENSYWGNPSFCIECLLRNKSSTIKPPSNSTQHHEYHQEDDGGFIDIESFCVTFGVSYIMVLLGIAAVLYINPYWREAWFDFVERFVTTCIYFFIDHLLPRRFRFCYI